jgi:3-deoxy-D-arabino-heptulosonate 7-phosphate (DAHP) synthase
MMSLMPAYVIASQNANDHFVICKKVLHSITIKHNYVVVVVVVVVVKRLSSITIIPSPDHLLANSRIANSGIAHSRIAYSSWLCSKVTT